MLRREFCSGLQKIASGHLLIEARAFAEPRQGIAAVDSAGPFFSPAAGVDWKLTARR